MQNQNFEDETVKALLRVSASLLVNQYTNENVLFGRIKPNDKVPAGQYLEDLGFDFHKIDKFSDDSFLNGNDITDGIVTDRNFDERCFELYRTKIESVFAEAPIDESYDIDAGILHYANGLYEYLQDLYKLFYEVMKTEVSPEFYASLPELLTKNEQRAYYMRAAKFVTEIQLKHLRKGCRLNRYFKNMPFISPIIRRLFKIHNGNFILTNSDTDSLDYKFALLSCIRFYHEDNAKLFELKLLRWEELNR